MKARSTGWRIPEGHHAGDMQNFTVDTRGKARSDRQYTHTLGYTLWRLITELRARTTKSVFHLDVTGSVTEYTHFGLRWLRYIRQHLGRPSALLAFEGWSVPQDRSVIAEVYPALWIRPSRSRGGRPISTTL